MDMVEFLCQEDDAPPFRVVIEKRRVLGLSEYPTTGETLIIIAGRKRLFGGGYEQHYLATKEPFENPPGSTESWKPFSDCSVYPDTPTVFRTTP